MARKKDKQAQKDKKALKSQASTDGAERKAAADAPAKKPQAEKG